MTARFRCPECKQALCRRNCDDPTRGVVLKCPECGARLVVPPTLIFPDRTRAELSEDARRDRGDRRAAGRKSFPSSIAACTPWLMSLLLHMALAVIFILAAMITVAPAPKEKPVRPVRVFRTDRKNPVVSGPESVKTEDVRSERMRRLDSLSRDFGRKGIEKPDDHPVIGPSSLLTGIDKTGPTIGKRVGFDDTIFEIITITEDDPDAGRDTVFLIDRSGSMVDALDRIRCEILMSIAMMRPEDRFHVILFSDGRPIESTPRSLTGADKISKDSVARFLKPVRAQGRTDPVPGINRGFDVLKRSGGRKDAVIHLLTDGAFPDNAAVLDAISRRNARGLIRINTILYGNRPPIAERVMKRIAKENGGTYRFVSRDE